MRTCERYDRVVVSDHGSVSVFAIVCVSFEGSKGNSQYVEMWARKIPEAHFYGFGPWIKQS